MALGPVLHWGSETVKPHIPLPYAIFYYLAPGFQAFRTPSRFMPLALMSSLIFSSMILSRSRVLNNYRWPFSILAIGMSLLVVFPISIITVPAMRAYPVFVSVLASRKETVLIKLPFRNWADPLAKEDTYQMVYALAHGKKIVNGQSGFFPDEWMSFQNRIAVS